MTGPEVTWDLVFEVLDVLDKHGFRQGDHPALGRAVGLVGDLAKAYTGDEPEEPPAAAVALPPPVPRLREQQRETLTLMLADALEFRTEGVGGPCRDCDTSPALVCADHTKDLELFDAYRQLGRELGIEAQS